MKKSFLILHLLVSCIIYSQTQFNLNINNNDILYSSKQSENTLFTNSKNTNEYIDKTVFSSLVIQQDDYFSIKVDIKNSEVKSVYLNNSYEFLGKTLLSNLYRNDDCLEKYELFDDGTNGDNIAGDHIYTANNFSVPKEFEKLKNQNKLAQVIWPPLEYELLLENNNLIKTTNPNIEFMFIVNPDFEIPNFEVTQLSDSIFCTDYIVNFIVNEPDFNSTYEEVEFFRNIPKLFYNHFEDVIDFFIYDISNFENIRINFIAAYEYIKNDIQGIDYKTFDYSHDYGSGGNLKGIILIEDFRGYGFSTISHELLHNWLLPGELRSENGHWNYIVRNSTGFCGINGYYRVWKEIEKLDSNYYRLIALTESDNINNSLSQFNDIELYLMGLISIDDIEFPIEQLINVEEIVHDWKTDPSYYKAKADSIRLIYKEDLIEILDGERDPDYTQSQKEFRIATLIPIDRKLNETEFNFYSFLVSNLAAEKSEFSLIDSEFYLTFNQATNNLATLNTKIGDALTNVQVYEKYANSYNLSQNYPNPFNPLTTIEYSIPEGSFVTIKIYDVLGREIKTLVNKEMQAGYHKVNFDASSYASGVYFYKIQAEEFSETKRMLLIK